MKQTCQQMKKNKALKFSILLIFIGIATVSFYYKAPIKRNLKKIYKERVDNSTNTTSKEGDSLWGIDISHHQGSINWKVLVEKNRPDFIFLKATEGSTHIDTKYSEYVKKSRELAIPVGAYHFFSYQSSGKDQAKNFIKNSKLIKGDIYPVLDVEYTKGMKDKTWIINEIKAFCKEIKKEYGVDPIIYCECDYYTKFLKNDFKNFSYWISDLYREPGCDYIIWQYTDRGFVHGIGNIDNNRFNKNTNIKNYRF